MTDADKGACETPMRDHVERFWRILETERVRVLVDTHRGEAGVTYFDSSSFGDHVAKALVAERAHLSAEVERLRGERGKDHAVWAADVARADRLKAALEHILSLQDRDLTDTTILFDRALKTARAALSSADNKEPSPGPCDREPIAPASPASEPVSDAENGRDGGHNLAESQNAESVGQQPSPRSVTLTAQERDLDAALAAYKGVWQSWSELSAENVDECRRAAMTAALAALTTPASPAPLDVRAQVIEECAKVAEGRKPATQDHISDLLAEQSDYIAAAIRALATTPPDDGWRTIESAPKDGTEILGVHRSDYEGFRPTVYGPWTIAFDRGEWRSSWDRSEVIMYMSDFGIEYKHPDLEPTHWRPLPTPPASLTANDGGERS